MAREPCKCCSVVADRVFISLFAPFIADKLLVCLKMGMYCYDKNHNRFYFIPTVRLIIVLFCK